jgi:TolA-binding protein
VANQDKSSKHIVQLRQHIAQLETRIAQLEAELAEYQQKGGISNSAKRYNKTLNFTNLLKNEEGVGPEREFSPLDEDEEAENVEPMDDDGQEENDSEFDDDDPVDPEEEKHSLGEDRIIIDLMTQNFIIIMHIIIQNTLDCVMKWPSWKKTLM